VTRLVNDDFSLLEEIHEIVRQNQELAVASQFAVSVMHEINGPLEAATNLNYLILLEADSTSQVWQYSKLLEEQLLSLATLSRQTLSFCRSSETCEEIAMSTLAEAALRIHQKKISAKRINVRRRLTPGTPVEVSAGDILQVLSNVITNALDALPENGTLAISVQRRTDEVHVTVSDNGSGIPAPFLTKIYDPFFTTKKERGTGLGLAISKSIIEKYHGRIRSRSSTRPGRSGTAFRISLPLSTRSPAASKTLAMSDTERAFYAAPEAV
jgi:C4-dicarboxylate-specific signal transduction histidine kinase